MSRKKTAGLKDTEPFVGRAEKRRRATRIRLLGAAYDEIAEAGLQDLKIKQITERADVGFGTFYNYFDSLYHLECAVLDCVIHDYGRRNVIATRKYRETDPVLIMPISMRLFMREVTKEPMWHWWARRPEQLAGRMRKGLGPFAKEDLRQAIRAGLFKMTSEEIDLAWGLMVWILVGGIHDIISGQNPPESERFIIQSVLKMLGEGEDLVLRASTSRLPRYTKSIIDWSFELEE